jgi:hypothetical protein
MITYIKCRCGHCQELAPKYREAASLLEAADLPRPVVLAKYDDSTDSQRRLRAGAEDVFNYNAYPALIIFDDGKHKHYTGGRNAQDIVTFMTAYSKGLDPHVEEINSKPGLYKNLPDYDPDVFLDLDPETFKSTVLADMQVGDPRLRAIWTCVEGWGDEMSLPPPIVLLEREDEAFTRRIAGGIEGERG